MSDAQDRIVALKCVIDLVQPEVAPTLTQGEIELEVDRAKLASNWAVNTFYKVGAVVVPPTDETKTGHSYQCVQPGTSQASARSFNDWPTCGGAKFSDGSSDPALIWREVGTDRFNPGIFQAETNVYDINRAAKRLWEIKARQASEMLQTGDVEFQHVYDRCLKMASTFRPFRRPIELIRA